GNSLTLNHVVSAPFGDFGLDQGPADPLAASILVNRERADLGHVAPGEVERRAAEDSVALERHVKIADVLGDAQDGAREHQLFGGEVVDQSRKLNPVFGQGQSNVNHVCSVFQVRVRHYEWGVPTATMTS